MFLRALLACVHIMSGCKHVQECEGINFTAGPKMHILTKCICLTHAAQHAMLSWTPILVCLMQADAALDLAKLSKPFASSSALDTMRLTKQGEHMGDGRLGYPHVKTNLPLALCTLDRLTQPTAYACEQS